MRNARRSRIVVGAVVVSASVAFLIGGCTTSTSAPGASPSASPSGASTAPAGGSGTDPSEVAAIQAAVVATMEQHDVRAAIVRVLRGDEVILTQAWGESLVAVPATTEMHFRSGAVAIPQVSTVLLQLVDEGVVALDDPLSNWLPDVPNAERVTLGQLAQMTSGYADYVQDADFLEAFNENPFRQWEPQELIAFGTAKPLLFEPGTNWGYAHTNYVLLSLALERITGEPMIEVIEERIFGPLGMQQTADPGTPEILPPVLHAFDSERREYLEIAEDLPYIEDSTFWNPSWSLGPGAVQNTDIADMATVIQAIGRGELVSDASFELMIAPTLRGNTTALPACPNTCFVQNEFYTYGLGIVLSGDWLLQNPQYHGFAGVAAYLPSEDVTIAIAATYGDAAFDPTTGAPVPSNIANPLFTAVASVIAPDVATPGT